MTNINIHLKEKINQTHILKDVDGIHYSLILMSINHLLQSFAYLLILSHFH